MKRWIDVVYSEMVSFSKEKWRREQISLCSNNMDKKLFRYLGELIPPGGHIMVSYEEEQNISKDTVRSLNIGIPPVATPFGLLIFQAGFQYVKDWYHAEGGHERPRKLWGEKALNDAVAQSFYEKTAQQIKKLLEKDVGSTHKELKIEARECSKEIVEIIKEKLIVKCSRCI